MDDGIIIAYDSVFLKEGVKLPVRLSFNRTPMVAVSGQTGTGKTVLVKLVCYGVAENYPDSEVIICDFKRDDFRYLAGFPNYYSFMACTDGINRFYVKFQEQQESDNPDRKFRLLVFDEWASYLNCISDKKTLESEKMKLATLLMLGRSYNFHVMVSQQRFDSSYFATARDQFSAVIMLGNISKEAAQMFGLDKDRPPVHGVGAGYMILHGAEQIAIQVPRIKDFKRLDESLIPLVSRPL
jgi:DNA segregation ATPase FtsK/SpoIIIE-like protein